MFQTEICGKIRIYKCEQSYWEFTIKNMNYVVKIWVQKLDFCLHIKQESPPEGNHKRRTSRGITCASHIQPSPGQGWGRDRGSPVRTGWGYPSLGLDGGTPLSGLDGGTPPLGQDGGTPQVDKQTVSKHYIPSYFVRGELFGWEKEWGFSVHVSSKSNFRTMFSSFKYTGSRL